MKRVLSLLAAGAMAAAAAVPAHADTATLDPVRLAGDPVLRGGRVDARMPVALPGAWREVSGQLRLRLRASRLLGAGSTLVLTANGLPIGATSVGPGDSLFQATIPPLRTAGRLTLGLEGRLRPGRCAQVTEPGSFVTLLSPSELTLTGRRDGVAPALSQFPGSFVERAGDQSRPLLVALPARPTPAEVQAAGLLAGAVARAGRAPSLRVVLASGSRAAGLAPQLGDTIELRRGRSRAAASIERRPGGFRRLTLSGRGRGLVAGAWQLATDSGSLLDRRAVLRGRVEREAVRGPSQRAARIAPTLTRSPGTSTLEARTVLPPEIELGRDAQAELRMAYDAPAGGRVTAHVNGSISKAKELRRDGDGRVQLKLGLGDQPVGPSSGDLRIGANTLGLEVTLPPHQGRRCRRDDRDGVVALLPSSRVWFDGGPRERRKPDLGLFPFPLSDTPTWEHAQVVLARRPSDRQIAEAVMVLAEQQRVARRPVLPGVVFGPRGARDDRDLLVLAPDRRLADALELDLPARPRRGSVMAARRPEDRIAYVAFGSQASRALRDGYSFGKLSGRAVSVAGDGRIRSRPIPLSAHRPPPSPFIFPVIALILIAGTWVALRFRRVRRRLRGQPAPSPIEAAGAGAPGGGR